jgi:hypothetical protein
VLLDNPPFAGARPELVRRAGDALRLLYLKMDDQRPGTDRGTGL